MSKPWRNPREIVARQAPAEPEDARRLDALVSLLATGVARLLGNQREDTPEPVDFALNVGPNTLPSERSTRDTR